MFQRPRLLIREITAKPPRRIFASFTADDFLSNKSTITILHDQDDIDALKALLGAVNSKLISFFYQGRAVKGARRLFPKIVINNLREFPIPKGLVNRPLIAHVERMLKLNASLPEAKSPDAQTLIQREMAVTDRLIDQIVYQLYGLSAEEIALIEAATALPESVGAEA